MRKYKVGIALFEYNSMVRREVRRWYGNAIHRLSIDNRIRGYSVYEMDQIGTDTARNSAVKMAQEDGVDHLFMIDHDVDPDFSVPKGQPSFIDIALSIMEQTDHPFVLGAPYCSALDDNKEERVLVFRYQDRLSEDPDSNMIIYTVPRGEAARKKGVENVDALGTGLTFFDMRCFERLTKPYFCYEYDADHTRITITEDVFICARLRAVDVPIYCAWDNWCGHWKWKRTGVPEVLLTPCLSQKFLSLVNKDYEHGRTASSVSLRGASGSSGNSENNPAHQDTSESGRAIEGSDSYAGAGNGSSADK